MAVGARRWNPGGRACVHGELPIANVANPKSTDLSALTKIPPDSSGYAETHRHSCRCGLALVLLVSFGLRIWLISLGGQGFWADEDRYTDGRNAAAELLHGQWSEAVQELLGHPDHTGFRWMSVPPGLVEVLAGPQPKLVACYFALFSVLAIYLIWAIARRSGSGEAEALWAAFLAATANSLFYYSRHYFPYDIALCAMLAALWLGLGPWSWRNSLLAGVWVGLGFLVYNGYWLLGGCVLILHTVLGQGGNRLLVARAAWSGAGLLGTLLVLLGLGRIAGHNLAAEDYLWGVAARGDFPFGHRVIGGYLWFGEGGVLVIWLAALAYALAGARRDRRLGRLAWSAGGLALVAGGLWILSDVVPLFTVQGRRVRCLVPFLCLAAATGITRFLDLRGRTRRLWSWVIALLVLGAAARNFSIPIRQVFPTQFLRQAARLIDGSDGFFAYRVAFAETLWGLPLDDLLPSSAPILQAPHPLQFRPYQYEGYDTAQRADINRHDVSMRLFRIPTDLVDAARRWAGYPGPLSWSVIFPSNRMSLAEPIVSTGRNGRGDFLFVRYIDRQHVAFGLDHWGSGAAISPPVAIDYGIPHQMEVTMGSLLPPAGGDFYLKAAEFRAWPNQVLVMLDGRVVFHWMQATWPASPREIMLGVNLIGGTAAQQSFSGQILRVSAAHPAEIDSGLRGPVLGALVESLTARVSPAAARSAGARLDPRGVSLGDITGHGERVAAVSFSLPPAAATLGQPLLAFTRSDGGLGLLAIRRSPRGLEVGWRDSGGWWWAPLPADPGRRTVTAAVQWSRMENKGAAPVSARLRHLAAMIAVDDSLYPHPNPQFFDVPLRDVAAWRDPAPVAGVTTAVFAGEAKAPPTVRALALPRDESQLPRHFRLAVRFPTNRPGRNEPLVTAGKTGAADGIYVHYESPGAVRIGYDHWGAEGAVSDPVPVAIGAYQILEIELGRGSWKEPDGGRITVKLDGQPVLSESGDLYPAESGDVVLGRNPIGLSTSDAEFTGEIFPIEDAVPAR